MKRIKSKVLFSGRGFTLIELLVAMAISGVVMGAVIFTFKSQQDSFAVQENVAQMHQNLRGAMHFISRDIQMAGFYTGFDINSYTMDWDPTAAGNETVRPIIYARDNDADGGGNDVREGTDLILIVKASDDRGTLAAGETVVAGTNQMNLTDLDLDNDTDSDLNTSGKKYGVLIKADLSKAEFFIVTGTGSPVTVSGSFNVTYEEGDTIARADIVIYKINEDALPALEMRNLGSDNGFQTVAEDITDMQIRYGLADGSWVDDPAASLAQIREVQVTLSSNVNIPQLAGSKQRSLTSTVKVRNLGINL